MRLLHLQDVDYGRNRDRDGAPTKAFEPSLFVWATVMSPRPRIPAIVGLKALAFDSGPRLVCDERAPDEHGRLAVAAATKPATRIIRLVPGHCGRPPAAGSRRLLELARRHHGAGERIRPDTMPFLGRHRGIAMRSGNCNRARPLDTGRMSRQVRQGQVSAGREPPHEMLETGRTDVSGRQGRNGAMVGPCLDTAAEGQAQQGSAELASRL
jgi:hypothetical protein